MWDRKSPDSLLLSTIIMHVRGLGSLLGLTSMIDVSWQRRSLGIDSTPCSNHFDRNAQSPSLLDMIGMYRLKSSFRLICRVACAFITIDCSSAGLDAYYTRLPIQHDDPISKVGRYADVVVRIDGERRIEFSRETSYLPYWVAGKKRGSFQALVERHGDGDERRPDRINRYSYVRVIENSPQKVVVHWRYIPDFSNLDWDGVVHEYFSIFPGGEVERVIRVGTARLSEWNDPSNRCIQRFKLGANGLQLISETQAARSNPKPVRMKGNPLIPALKQVPKRLWLPFDDALHQALGSTTEMVTQTRCAIEGHDAVWRKGVSGTAGLFDGYYTKVVVPKNVAPTPDDGLSVQAWVALAAYPFHWAPIVHQSEWGTSGYYLGVNALGQLGCMAQIGGKWVQLQASSDPFHSDLPLFKWQHVAASHDGTVLRLFLNGKEVASVEAVGKIQPAERDLVIGLNTQAFSPTSPIREWATYPSIFGIDGLIDEVMVDKHPINATALGMILNQLGDPPAADLESRDLPRPQNEAATPEFGARYQNLKFHEGFDHMWRVGEDPDVVVSFDQSPCQLIFWKGMRYAPAMVTENNKWAGDQSAETSDHWGRAFPLDEPDAVGCAEHMSDAQARHSHVRIIESTPARVVIHWRYVGIDVRYVIAKDDDGWGAWADEYYSVYPDGVAIRHVARNTGGWQETMFYNAAGTRPEDNIELDAYTLVNSRGDSRTYSWEHAPNPYPKIPGDLELAGDPFVSMVNLKSKWRPFYIYQGGSVKTFSVEARDGYSHFPWWNHYPVSQAICDGRSAERPDRTTHSSLVWGKPKSDYLMIGLTNQPAESLLPLAWSWARPPQLEALSGCRSLGYRPQRRDYHLQSTGGDIELRIHASKESPIHNLCMTIEDWKPGTRPELLLNGMSQPDARMGVFTAPNGKPALVLFAQFKSDAPLNLSLRQLNSLPVSK